MQPNWYTPQIVNELRALLSQQLAIDFMILNTRAAWGIASQWIIPEVREHQGVWVAQMVFPADREADIGLNNPKGKVRVGGKWREISKDVVSDLQKIESVKLDTKEAHVTLFFAKDKDGVTQIKTLSYLTPIIPAIVKPPLPEMTEIITMVTCQNCGNLFLPEPNHPHQKYCSTRCRETAQKRRYRENLKKNEPLQKKK